MAETRLWSRAFSLTLIVSFFLSLVFYLLMTTMAGYAMERFAADDAQAGLASSMYVVGALISRFWAGAVADAVGRRRVLLIALGAFTLASLGYPLAGGLVPLLLVRFAHGTAFGVAHTAAATIVQTAIPPARRAEGTAYYGTSPTVATAAGPAFAILLCQAWGYSALFAAATVASVIAMVFAVFIPASPPQPREASAFGSSAGGRVRRQLTRVVEPAAVPISLIALILGTAYSAILAFLNSYAASVGLASVAATFFLVYTVAVLVTRLFAGQVQDRHGDNIIMYPAILCFAAGMAVLAMTNGATVLLISGALIGAGFGTAMSAGQTIAVSAAPDERVGRSVSTYFLLLDLGTGVGPVFLGLLIGAAGYRSMFAVLAGMLVAAIPLYRLVHGRGPTSGRCLPPQREFSGLTSARR